MELLCVEVIRKRKELLGIKDDDPGEFKNHEVRTITIVIQIKTRIKLVLKLLG
jgi:hypothetical protein